MCYITTTCILVLSRKYEQTIFKVHVDIFISNTVHVQLNIISVTSFLQTQQHVLSMLVNSDATLKILLTTAALGMGADIKHIQQIIHLSPPSTIEGMYK